MWLIFMVWVWVARVKSIEALLDIDIDSMAWVIALLSAVTISTQTPFQGDDRRGN
jgi:hypothetical protein